MSTLERDNFSLEDQHGTLKMVLVVEDDAELGPLLVRTINKETPYYAILATNGVQALKIVRNVAPHLFLLDYRLPGMNGFELYLLLHEMQGLEDVPAILMSASTCIPRHNNEQHILLFMHKPFELDTLLNLIGEFVA